MGQKNTSFIRDFYRKLQGREYENLLGELSEAKSVLERARQTRDIHGLTRDEFIILEGSSMTALTVLTGQQDFGFNSE